MLTLVFSVGAIIAISFAHWIYNWRNPKCDGQLPPGSMGWPLLGETLQFFAPNTTHDIPPFVKKRMEKYGPIFRTSIVGRPVIMSADSDLNYFIFQQEGQLFQSWYPDTFTEIFGRQNVGSLHGFMYKYLKNMVLNLFGPESLKKMLPEVEEGCARTETRRHDPHRSDCPGLDVRAPLRQLRDNVPGNNFSHKVLNRSSFGLETT